MLTSISTGNAITTAIILAMFVYLFFKLNIKFIIREFTIIIFTIFTPFAVGLWIINKNVTAASIWAGQIIMNIFMQFIYCFLFLMYIIFIPVGSGWAVSLIWAMMILPLADALQNCFQNLTSRIAGVDNEQMANRVVGASAMLGFGLNAIKEQFRSPVSTVSDEANKSTTGLKGIVNRAKSIINPTMNLSSEKDYNGNTNPIRDVIPKEQVNIPNGTNAQNVHNENNKSVRTIAGKVVNTSAKATKAYLGLGANLIEGDFSKYYYPKANNKANENRNDYKNIEYMNKLNSNANEQNLGDENEPKRE